MLLFVVFLGLERHGVTLKEGDIDAVQWDRGLRFSAKILFQKGGSLRLERPSEPLEGGIDACIVEEFVSNFRC